MCSIPEGVSSRSFFLNLASKRAPLMLKQEDVWSKPQ